MKPRVIPGDRKVALEVPTRSVRLEKSHVRVNPKPFPLRPADGQPAPKVQNANGAVKAFGPRST
ncbi:MAG: hypothetical protein KIS92_04240 [Planctomycetota bacterium]|nr:hypothetical protein [Planctomycetota bacterium]